MGGCGWVRAGKAKVKMPSILIEKQAPRKEKDSSHGGKDWKGIRCLTDSVTLTSESFLATSLPETTYSYESGGLPRQANQEGRSYSRRKEKKVTYEFTL